MTQAEDQRTDDGNGAHGRSPAEWQRLLTAALDAGDHSLLHQSLLEMRAELRTERSIQRAHDHGPLLERLAEQARRLLRVEPTALEALRAELEAERRLWGEFRERYRQAFVPADLLPFLDGCGVFIHPDDRGHQFDGFEKFGGRSGGRVRESVLLFRRVAGAARPAREDPAPANFFAAFDVPRGRFYVRRCYRTGLPRGAGTLVLVEQLRALVPDLSALKTIAFENVQNRATFAAHVRDTDPLELRSGVAAEDTPIGRLALRVLAAANLAAGALQPSLDRYGILDLRLHVARS